MHDVLVPGMTIKLAPPFGSFTQDTSQSAVLISAGIGITAMKALKQGLGNQVKHFCMWTRRFQMFLFWNFLNPPIPAKTRFIIRPKAAQTSPL